MSARQTNAFFQRDGLRHFEQRVRTELEHLTSGLEKIEAGAAPDADWARDLYQRLIARRRFWLNGLGRDASQV